jgi:hypothetical protein
MDIKEEIVVVENVGGSDGLACEDVVTNNSNVEIVRPAPSNSLENEVLQLATI